MICTILGETGKGELIFGRQEFTGIDKPQFYEVPEALIDEIRTCDITLVQSVISKIKEVCPEIM